MGWTEEGRLLDSPISGLIADVKGLLRDDIIVKTGVSARVFRHQAAGN